MIMLIVGWLSFFFGTGIIVYADRGIFGVVDGLGALLSFWGIVPRVMSLFKVLSKTG